VQFPLFRKQTKPLLLLGFGGLLLLMGVLGVSAISFLYRIDSRHERIRQQFVERNRGLEALRSDLYLLGTHVRDYLLTAAPSAASQRRSAFLDTRSRVLHEVADYGARLHPEETEPFHSLQQELTYYLETLDEVFQWSSEERLAMGNTFIEDQVLPKRAEVITLADHIEQLNERRMEASSFLKSASGCSGWWLRLSFWVSCWPASA